MLNLVVIHVLKYPGTGSATLSNLCNPGRGASGIDRGLELIHLYAKFSTFYMHITYCTLLGRTTKFSKILNLNLVGLGASQLQQHQQHMHAAQLLLQLTGTSCAVLRPGRIKGV